jgi:isoleucyl-tRNA synthetase
VVRLWVASQDFRNDIIVSDERIAKVGETYRVIRNALRYQLSNLYDFDPAKHTVADDQLTGLDRWILSEFSKLEADVIKAYDAYEFHVVYQKVSQFVAVELSAIYHDVIKDRLYTDPANSPRRRSTQTTLHRLVTGLCQMLAPILAFTADEAWEFVPKRSTESVHASDWKLAAFALTKGESDEWQLLLKLRSETLLPELEKLRQVKHIGKALEAKIQIAGYSAGEARVFEKNKEALRELINVSQLDVTIPEGSVVPSGQLVAVGFEHADGQKCERCWHWETDVGSHPEHPTLCGRCVEAVGQYKP